MLANLRPPRDTPTTAMAREERKELMADWVVMGGLFSHHRGTETQRKTGQKISDFSVSRRLIHNFRFASSFSPEFIISSQVTTFSWYAAVRPRIAVRLLRTLSVTL